MFGQKPPRKRAFDALVGTAIAALVIAAATFGELGPTRHTAQTAVFGSVQPPHRAFKAKTIYPKLHCVIGRDCRR